MPENNGLLLDFIEFEFGSSVTRNKFILIIYFCNMKTTKQVDLVMLLDFYSGDAQFEFWPGHQLF
jgi:hypothetical protein